MAVTVGHVPGCDIRRSSLFSPYDTEVLPSSHTVFRPSRTDGVHGSLNSELEKDRDNQLHMVSTSFFCMDQSLFKRPMMDRVLRHSLRLGQ